MAPFRFKRRVGFGECDPARIFFAPRAIEYAIEAAEAFSEEVLALPWSALATEHGREARVLSVDCTYERSVTADQVIEIAVEPVQVGPESLTLSAVADVEPGQVSFRATVVLALAERGGAAPLPLPPELVARLGTLGLPAPEPSLAEPPSRP
ncbi:MAG: acyl-CoA thioesterase, partial [Anaeromyxobacteraceae bacterium]